MKLTPQMADLMDDLRRAGVELLIENDRLFYRPNVGLSGEQVDQLRRMRADLIQRDRRLDLRRHVASLIRQARSTGRRTLAIALRDAWIERLAVCTVDGGLSELAAEKIGLTELESFFTGKAGEVFYD